MPSDSKLTTIDRLVYSVLHASASPDGVVEMPHGTQIAYHEHLGNSIGLPAKNVRDSIDALISAGLVERCGWGYSVPEAAHSNG